MYKIKFKNVSFGFLISLTLVASAIMAMTQSSLAAWNTTTSPANQVSPVASDVPAITELNNGLVQHFFTKNTSGIRRGMRTDALLIIHNGDTVFEKYDRGYDENMQHIMWSASKTAMALLYGVAVGDGLIQLSQSICDVAPFDNKEFCKIRIQDVLQWSTDIKWSEEYEKTKNIRNSSVVAMLYGQGYPDMAGFVKAQAIDPRFSPGHAWRYSSGDSILAAYLLEHIYKGHDLRKVYREKLFDPLQMKHWTWESDSAGTIAGAYYFFTTARGLAQIGALILNNGFLNGKQVVPSSFIQFMKTMPDSFKERRLAYDKKNISGAHLWLNDPGDTGLPTPWAEVPKDAVAAMGHWGQYLLVVPSLKLVAVRMGDTRDASLSMADFARTVVRYATDCEANSFDKTKNSKRKSVNKIDRKKAKKS